MSKVWLITGSSRGLGRELAKAVLAAGHHLVATARAAEDLHDLVSQYGERVRAVALDVTNPAAARAAIAVATSAFGRLDVVVNNAGYANINSIEDVADDDFHAQVDTNFFGVVNATRAAQVAGATAGAGQTDPGKAAQATLRIASEHEPPWRRLLGSDAVFLAGVV